MGLRAILLASAAGIPPAPSFGEQPAAAAPAAPRYHGAFRELPLGAVQPRGWIANWLDRQVNGLTGHPETMGYPYDTALYVGRMPPVWPGHGELWWPYEDAGYYLDGLVRLNAMVRSPRIEAVANANLTALKSDHEPARLGGSTSGWTNTVVGRALMAQHSRTGDPDLLKTLLTVYSNKVPLPIGRDGFVIEQMLYLYGQTGDPKLLAAARAGFASYFLTDAKSFSNHQKIRSLHEHGVTAAEQLKLAPLYYCHAGDQLALELAQAAYRKVLGDSLMPDGALVSSEFLGAPTFDAMHETCDIVDWSWSLGYMLMADGDARWADAIEKMTFNALPGALTKDFKQLQYFSLANQLLASNTQCEIWSPSRISYRAAHETECCAGNVHRAMPNYVSRMWMRVERGLAATLYGPCVVTADIGGRKVTITEDTDYPFRERIRFTIASDAAVDMTLALKIPGWCEGARIAINGTRTRDAPNPGSFVELTRAFQPGDVITLTLPMTVGTRNWFGGEAASVERGPLVFSMPVPETAVESWVDPPEINAIMNGHSPSGAPALEFFPAGEWRYGIGAGEVAAARRLKVREHPMTDNPFAVGQSPVSVEVTLTTLPRWYTDWQAKPVSAVAQFRTRTGPPVVEENYRDFPLAPKNPKTLPATAERAAVGATRVATLVPYGSTHLRITTFPIVAS